MAKPTDTTTGAKPILGPEQLTRTYAAPANQQRLSNCKRTLSVAPGHFAL